MPNTTKPKQQSLFSIALSYLPNVRKVGNTLRVGPVTVYVDGLGYGRRNLRLSNFPGNFVKLVINTASLVGLSKMSPAAAYYPYDDDVKDTYFTSQNNTNYLLKTMKNIPKLEHVLNKLEEGACHVTTNVTTIALDYDVTKEWNGEEGSLMVQLERDSRQESDEETEECVKRLITSAVDAINTIVKKEDRDGGYDMAYILCALGAAVLFTGLTVLACRAYHRRCTGNVALPVVDEESGNVVDERAPLVSEASAQPIDKGGFSGHASLKLTNEERLAAIGITDINDVSGGEEFVCPITRTVFEDPVIIFDGHTYERAYIEPLRGKPCPLNDQRIITDFYPNVALRRQLEAFISTLEEAAKKSKHNEGAELAAAATADNGLERRRYSF